MKEKKFVSDSHKRKRMKIRGGRIRWTKNSNVIPKSGIRDSPSYLDATRSQGGKGEREGKLEKEKGSVRGIKES